jgi:nucleotide-binding universal stress UspA family protein
MQNRIYFSEKYKNHQMKKILVTTDFSESASNAVKYATGLAVALDADLTLLHIYQQPVPLSEIPVIIDREKDIQKMEDALIQLCNELKAKTSRVIDIHYAILYEPFFTALSEYCDKIQPYLVVMGSQGSTAAERLLIGGHTVHTMKHLRWPVLTVPPDACFNGISKIGLACDLHDVPAMVPAQKLNKLTDDLHAELHVLNIGKPGTYDTELLPGSEALSRLRGKVKPTFHFLTGRDTDRGIIEFADKIHINLLVVLPREHGYLHRIFHSSHTQYFVLHSHVPVLALQQAVGTATPGTTEENRIGNTDRM